MKSPEELQRRQDQAIAFYKNRLDLALAHQKEITTLFFKVTIGYFAILYGVFLIYKMLFDTDHFKNVDFFLYLILFFFSSTFFSWALRSLVVLHSLDLRVNTDQGMLDRELHKSRQIILPEQKLLQTMDQFEEYLEEQILIKEDDDLREITFEHNSQTLLLILGIIILIVPLALSIYTIGKMPQNGWQWICTIFLLGLSAISVYFDNQNNKKSKQKTQQLNDLANKNTPESH